MLPTNLRLPWQRRERPPAPRGRGRLANVLLVVALALTVPLVAMAVSRGGDAPTGADGPGASTGAVPGLGSPAPTTAAPSPPDRRRGPEQRVQARLAAALSARAFPQLQPSPGGTAAWAESAMRNGCLDRPVRDPEPCDFGPSGSRDTVVVVGDDAAAGYVPAIRAALGERFLVRPFVLDGCPVWNAPVTRADGRAFPECDAYRASVWAEVRRRAPDVLVLTSSWRAGARVVATGTDDAVDDVLAGYLESLDELVPSARLAVVLAPPPGGEDLQVCRAPAARPRACVAQVPEPYEVVAEAERQLAEQAGAVYVDSRDWFCVDDACPAFVGSTPVYADGVHLTEAYAKELADVVLAALAGAADQVRTSGTG